MIGWILILYSVAALQFNVAGNGAPSMATARFATQATCEQARAIWVQRVAKPGYYNIAVCVPE